MLISVLSSKASIFPNDMWAHEAHFDLQAREEERDVVDFLRLNIC